MHGEALGAGEGGPWFWLLRADASRLGTCLEPSQVPTLWQCQWRNREPSETRLAALC